MSNFLADLILVLSIGMLVGAIVALAAEALCWRKIREARRSLAVEALHHPAICRALAAEDWPADLRQREAEITGESE